MIRDRFRFRIRRAARGTTRHRVVVRVVGAFLGMGAVAAAEAAPADSSGARRFDEPWNIHSATSNVRKDLQGERIFSFIDDVVITHGDLTVTCEQARYVEGSALVLMTGHVVMTRDSTIVRGPVAQYDRESRRARLPRGIVIERPTGTAIADHGTWWRDDAVFELRGKAAAADTSGTLDANAMTYDEAAEAMWAVGDARFVDDVSGVVIEGQNLRYERADGHAVATGAPSAVFEEDDGVPVRVTADRLTYDPVDRVAVATGDVRIERETMEGHSEYAAFYRAVNRVVLSGNPEVVDGMTAISGERIVLDAPEPGRRIVSVDGAARVSNRFLGTRTRPEALDDAAPGLPDDVLPEGVLPEVLPEDVPLEDIVPSAVPEGIRDRIEEAGRAIVEAADSVGVGEWTTESATAAADSLLDEVAPTSRQRVEASIEAARAAGAAGKGDVPGDAAVETDEEEIDPTPPWLKTPSDQLPTENLLFGDSISLLFVDDELQTVEVTGHGRSKFFPNEEAGELTEWNDVTGDTLHVWFTESAVDSVTVLGNGAGEYRLPAGESSGASAAILLDQGRLVEYRAPRIRYRRATETMSLDRGAEVHFKTMILRSGEIDFEANREVMVASGDPSPILDDAGDEIFGRRMLYHLGSRQGVIEEGRTKFDEAYYHGTEIWKMGDDVLAVKDAAYTSCDLERPHYHFSSGKMKIYMGDKVVAKPIVLKIREIPVFWLPYYMATLKKGRVSGFLLPNLELGVDDNRGRFLRNLGYYWAPNDYMDLTTSFDFYPAQDRIVSYLNGRYKSRYRFDGRATLKYNRDVPNNRKDTALELEHRQTLSETMTLNGSARFVSTSSIYRDIDDDQRLDRDIRSHATFTKKFTGSNRSFRAEVERRENLDTGRVDETLPILSFSQPNRPITGRPRGAALADGEEPESGWLDEVYYRLNSRFARIRSKAETGVETRHTGTKTDISISTGRTVLPYVQIRPSGNFEAAWIDRDRLGETDQVRATYNAAVSADTKVYGTFLGSVGPARGFRHVAQPRVSWSWAPEFREYFYRDENGFLQDRFVSFGGIGGTQRRTNRMSFSFANLFQTKVARGEEEKRYDLFNLNQSISYDFLAKEDDRKGLSNLSSSLRVLSSQPVNQTWTVSHDPYDWNLISSSVTTRVSLNSQMFLQLRRARGGGEADGTKGGAGDAGPGEGGDGAEVGGDPFSDEEAEYADYEGDLGARPGGRGNFRPGFWRVDLSHTARRGGTSNLVLNSDWSPTDRWRVSFMTEYDLKEGENTRQQWSIERKIHCWQIAFDRRLLGSEWQYYLRVNVTDIPDIQTEFGDRFGSRRGSSVPGSSLF